jgi:acyl dehydratase
MVQEVFRPSTEPWGRVVVLYRMEGGSKMIHISPERAEELDLFSALLEGRPVPIPHS